MNRLMKDLAVDRMQNPDAALLDKWETEEDEDQEGEDINIIDRDEERWPGQYIDVTRARRHGEESINWPRPG